MYLSFRQTQTVVGYFLFVLALSFFL